MDNLVLSTIMGRASVRRFEDRPVPRELVERIVAAGRQAPFTGQMYSVVAFDKDEHRQELAKHFGRLAAAAPVLLLLCLDLRKLELFIAHQGRSNQADDLSMLILGIQDVAYAGQNMVLAAESLGLGSVFLGAAPFLAPVLVPLAKLPPRVYPVVGLLLGYPAESPPPRPRLPLEHVLFWDEYRDLDRAAVEACLDVMDAGLLREGYYRNLQAKIPVTGGPDPVDYDTYGWGEHVSRKYGQRRGGGFLGRSLRQELNAQGIDP